MNQDTRDFMGALWGTKPQGSAIQLWRRSDKRTHYYRAPEAAADMAASITSEDIYLAAGLAAKVAKPNKRRASAGEVVAIPGAWADIDVNGGPEDKTGAAPTREAAVALASAVLTPTLIVNSGYGIQAWWLFDDCWAFRTEDEREQAARLVNAFQMALRAAANKQGFNLDATHDLARLMRIPGTKNCKGRACVDVELLDGEGPRYAIEDIGQASQDFIGQASGLSRNGGGEVEIGDINTPPGKLLLAQEMSDEFQRAWKRRKPSGRLPNGFDDSMSAWDLRAANHMVRFGWTDQEIVDALRYRRAQASPSDPKLGRGDYWSRTIGVARAQRTSEARAEERENVVRELTSLAAVPDPTVPPERVVGLFNKVVGGPVIKEMIQDSEDPDFAQYRLVLADGREVPVGGPIQLLEAKTFRARFMAVTGHVMPGIKQQDWSEVVQALLNHRVVNNAPEASRSSALIGSVRDFIGPRPSTDRDSCLASGYPFEHDGMVWLVADPFLTWLRKVKGERMTAGQLYSMLRSSGFERRTLNYESATAPSGHSTRSCWGIERDVLYG